MLTAERNGYTSATLGCPFICADGFIGTSDFRVDLPEGYLLKEAYVAQAIAARYCPAPVQAIWRDVNGPEERFPGP